MSNLTHSEGLPNPFTPMAFLPPDMAYQKAIATYVSVGGVGIFIWDLITHLRMDWKLTFGFKIKIPIVVYHVSRWSTLIYLLTSVIFETAPLGNCSTFLRATCAVYHIAISSRALLFFFRVRAIYDRNKWITALFSILWISVVAGSATIINGLSAVRIGTTEYCTYASFKSYTSSTNITICVFDTSVFIAITWRLLSNAQSIPEESKSKGKFGFFLPEFSRALLRDGQNYYMVAMVSNLLVLGMMFSESIPVILRTLFFVPVTGLTNIMACRVFRNTKSGRYDYHSTMGGGLGGGTMPIVFRNTTRGAPSVPISLGRPGRLGIESTISISHDAGQAANIRETHTPSDNSAEKLPIQKTGYAESPV